ncbi:AbrB family transcriptional regulator [Niveispirillum sp.]|uniref:AbrB family transcriptional regulator n=1 Tax=Niveispirillum sp. TaxID=1917217 RepID=UPI001B5EB3D4|nr:AbrB family transcriptional regulator [Niveispirillum sp.]MBP7337603.1 AbrB family transcriptional regulator [Niveispirillum sp.]
MMVPPTGLQPEPAPNPRRRRFDWPAFATAMVLGTAGGFVCFRLHVPLAFMIGAMVATTVAALGGVRTMVPQRLRDGLVIVLGIMLGSSFTPALLGHLGEWSVSLIFMAVYIAVAAGLGTLYLRRFARYEPPTAYFTAMPGGFTEMVMMGGAMGGDDRSIALGHSLRIMLVVMTVPFAFQALPGYDPAGRDWSLHGLGPYPWELDLIDYVVIAACFVGAPVAQRLGIPAGILVGPMLLSAALHLTGVTAVKPPGLLVAAAQVVIGASIGGRFQRVPLMRIARTAGVAAGLTLLLLVVTLVLSLAVHLLTGLSLAGLILAFAPGGLAEMSLVALALHVDAAFVATHHIVRIVLIILFAPAAYHLWRRWVGRKEAPGA